MITQVFTLEQLCEGRASGLAPFQARDNRLFGISSSGQAATLHEVLRHLTTMLTLSLPLDQMLATLSSLTMQALNVDLCVVLLRNQTHNMFTLCAWSPNLSEKGIDVQPVSLDAETLECLRESSTCARLPHLSYRQLESLNPLKNVLFETLQTVPLYLGNECLGLVNCYASSGTHFSEEDELMLTTIATQVALAIKHLQGSDEDVLAQKRVVKALVQDICAGAPDGEDALRRRARIAGFDLSKPHTVTLLEISERLQKQSTLSSREERHRLYNAAIGEIQQFLEGNFPGSLIDERGEQLTCLLGLADSSAFDRLRSCLDQLEQRLRSEYGILLSAGIGNLCHVVGDYQRSYAEAREALDVGQCLHQESGITHFNDLGAYRYLYKFARTDTLHDRYQQQIGLIVEYDERKKTNLLETVESYLECGGNIAKTSSLLDIHRNTLLQRLERLQKLCDLDLEQCHYRLPLLIALKVHRLRMRQES